MTTEKNSLESYIIEIVENCVENKFGEMARKEVQEIAEEIIGSLDEIISKKIKQHLVALSQNMIDQFKDEE
jgi:hypothetical protein